MSRIQSNVGLITGIPIQDTVNQIMVLAARPRDNLQARNDGLAAERTAIDQVASLLLGFRFAVSKLDATTIYSATTAKSSEESLLSVVASTDPAPKPGSYRFTPLQSAAAHQVVSSSFTDVADQLASGNLRIGIGGHVDQGIALAQLNSGSGVQAGSIRIVDRSGASSDIDLRTATSIDDVLTAINSDSTIDVTASVVGDAIKLIDNTGGTGTLRVKEVGIGSTAASLGLAGINVAADEATGADLFALHDQTLLTTLNDGAGVRLREAVDDLAVTLADGSTLNIDLGDSTTLGDVLDAINTADAAKLTATIAADGNRLELTDLTSGGSTFAVTSIGVGTAAKQLGLTEVATGGKITGALLVSGIRDTLISSLNGGQGLGTLGGLEIIDHTGAPTISVSPLNNGVAIDDDATGTGYLMYSAESIHNRFSGTANPDNADHFIGVRNNGGQWQYNTNVEWVDFNPVGTDVLVAEVDFTNDTVTDLAGTDETENGISKGYVSGNLVFTPNLWGGQPNVGELAISGSQFVSNFSSTTIDLSAAETLGEVVEAINASSAQVVATVNAARNGITITDASGNSNNLSIANSDSSGTADALRLTGTAPSDAINSGSLDRQIVSESTHLDSLKGGVGISLGDFRITDSDGVQSAVSLDSVGSEAKTIGDVIDAINATGIGVEARINDKGDGIVIVDTAGGTGTLTVTEVGDGTTAADLRLVGASNSINSSGQQIIDGSSSLEIDFSTLQNATSPSLSSLNGGAGISLGLFSIADSAGSERVVVRLDEPGNEAFTVQDVIDKINAQITAAGVSVTASLNDDGTGIELTDTAGGSGTLLVEDLGSGRSAADLKIAGEATTNGNEQVIDGADLFAAQDTNQNALDSLASAINSFGGGFTASTFFDGNGYRISITSDTPGAANELLIDTSSAGFSIADVSRPQDAVLQVGDAALGGVVITSTDNTFEYVAAGLDVTIQQASTLPVDIEVTADNSGFVAAAQDFVDSFNSLRDTLSELTSFDAETLTTGLLFGRGEVVRVESDLSRLLSGRFSSSSTFQSFEAIGISLDDKGKLSLDQEALTEAYEANPVELRQLFTADGLGIVDQFHTVIDALAGEENSVLSVRSDTLSDKIKVNDERILSMQNFLDRERERTLLEFFRLEETIGQLQSNFGVLESIQALPPLSITRTNQ